MMITMMKCRMTTRVMIKIVKRKKMTLNTMGTSAEKCKKMKLKRMETAVEMAKAQKRTPKRMKSLIMIKMKMKIVKQRKMIRTRIGIHTLVKAQERMSLAKT